MVIYKKKKITARDPLLDALLKLSESWAAENCCPAYYKNNPEEFIDKDVYLAIKENCLIGYAVGHISVQEEETSYNKVGEKAFEVDEIYVMPTYRDRGIGKKLFRFLEKDIRNRVDVIGVIATSYQYYRLLKFYTEELDLQFNHALLVKRTHP